MTMELISVIIPVYNGESTLRGCVESLLSGTYPSLELIIVDDGSSDGSARIAKELADGDSRVRVVSPGVNRGVSFARNRGLDEAQGSLIGFCDADDTVEPMMYERLAELIKNADAALMACLPDRAKYYPDFGLFNKRTFMELLLTDRIKSYFPFGLYRRKLIGDIRFNVKYAATEDTDILYRIMERADAIAGTKECYYNYDTESPSSASRKRRTVKWLYPASLVSLDKYVWAVSRYPEVGDELLYQAVELADIACIRLYHEKDMQKLGEIRSALAPHDEAISANAKLSEHKKRVAHKIIAGKLGSFELLYMLHELKQRSGRGR